MDITNIGNIKPVGQANSPVAPPKVSVPGAQNDDFMNSIKKGLESVQKIQDESSAKIKQAVTESNTDPADAIISMLKAEISMQLTLNVRNKLIEAYQEITRMSI